MLGRKVVLLADAGSRLDCQINNRDGYILLRPQRRKKIKGPGLILFFFLVLYHAMADGQIISQL